MDYLFITWAIPGFYEYTTILCLPSRNSACTVERKKLYSRESVSRMCEELEKMGIKKEQITYVPNGVNVQSFNLVPEKNVLRKKFGIPEQDIVILSVGRLTPKKELKH